MIGPAPIRFSSLFRSIGQAPAYLRRVGNREPSGVAGHNPLGSLAIIAMLAALAVQAGAGLFIESEDFFESAPFAHLVSQATSDTLIWIHRRLPNVIIALVALHIGAMLFYLIWKRENLISAMITGWKWVRRDSH